MAGKTGINRTGDDIHRVKPPDRFSGMFMSQRHEERGIVTPDMFDNKFDTAIRLSQIQQFELRQMEDNASLDDKLITQSKYYVARDPHTQIKTNIVAQVYDQLRRRTEHHTIIEAHHDDHFRKLRSMVNKSVEIQVGYLMSQYHILNRQEIFTKMNTHQQTNELPSFIKNLMTLASWFSKVVAHSNAMFARKYFILRDQPDIYVSTLVRENFMECPYLPITVFWSGRLVGMVVNGESYLLPKPALLMVQNKLCDMISVLMLATYSQQNSNPYDSYTTTFNFLSEIARLSLRYNNEFFSIIKTLESLVVAETLFEVETWKNDQFLLTMVDELSTELGYTYIGSPLENLLQNVPIPMRHELGCLSKIMGHPLVDMDEGSASIYKKTTERYNLCLATIKKSECFIKENYIRNHINKHGKWPPHQLDPAAHPALVTASQRNEDPCSSKYTNTANYPVLNIEDWAFVKILPNMVFSKLENAIPHLKDKTISLLRSNIVAYYINKEDTQQDHDWKHTRLLLSYLIQPATLTNHVQYLDDFTYCDTLDQLHNYLVLRIVPKEKELKIAYRGFGCKTYNDRIRALAQEKNVMQYLDEYSDEQAMTLDELSLARKLKSFRRLKEAYTNHFILYITIDASSWNNHFRAETVDDIMHETLDAVFNYPIFSKTMEAYRHTLFYVPDEAGTAYWYGQEGGIEGLNQDTWVVTYLGQIKTAISTLNRKVKVHILCKGDDLRVAVIVSKAEIGDTELGEFKNQIVTAISKTAAEFGHKIKTDDSYGSEQYFSFSKVASYGTIEMPQTYRKIQKAYGANNSLTNSKDDYIGSTFSNAHSAAKTAPYPVACYQTGLSWMYYYLLSDEDYAKLPVAALVALSLIPNMLGGFPIIYLHNFFVRAESDLLPPFLGLMQYCCENYIDIGEYMANMCYCSFPARGISMTRIYGDPYALPVELPQQPSYVLRESILPALKTIVKNEHVKELFQAGASPENDLCIEALDTSDRILAKTFSIIYAALPQGIIKELIAKFESSKSIITMLLKTVKRKETAKIMANVIRSETKLQNKRMKMLRGDRENYDNSFLHLKTACPAEFAQKIRDWAWGKPVDEVTMPPAQHLLEFTTQAQSQFDEYDRNNHFEFRRTETTQTVPNIGYTWEQYEGTATDPFIGSSTTTATSEPKIHFIENDVILSKVKNLLNLRYWVCDSLIVDGERKSGNIVQLIDKVINIYTKRNIEELLPFSGRRLKGTRTHHLRGTGYRAEIVPNCLSNIYQQFVGSSQSHVRLSASSDNYLINFLQLYCHSISVLSIELGFSMSKTTPEITWVVTKDCPFCWTPIYDQPAKLNTQLLKAIQFSPLEVTSLSDHMEEVLLKSMAMYENSRFRAPIDVGALDSKVAAHGILLHLSITTRREQQRLQSRYTDHTLSTMGSNVLRTFLPTTAKMLVTARDIQKINIKDLVDVVSHIIYGLICATNYVQDDDAITLAIGLNPVTSIPWYSLVVFLSSCNVISQIIIFLCQELHLPLIPNYVQPEQATIELGILCQRYVTETITDLDLVILTNYELEETTSYISNFLQSHQWYMIFSHIIHWTDLTEDQVSRTHLAVQGLIILSFEYWNKDFITITPDNEYDDITLGQLCELKNEEELRAIRDDYYTSYIDTDENIRELGLPWMFFQMCKQIRVKPKEVLEQYFDDDVFERNEVITRRALEGQVIKLHVLALADCLYNIDNDDTPDHIVPNTIVPDNYSININMTPRLVNLLRLDPPGIHNQEIDPNFSNIVAPVDPIKVELGGEYLQRPFGHHNTSASVFYEIWDHVFNVASITPAQTHMSISALGDGFGSITECFSQVYNSSKILYTTLPDVTTHRASPDVALFVADQTNCEIIYDHIEQGIYDLSDSNTLQYYERIMPINHAVWVDAEVLLTHDGAIKLPKIWYNTTRYFLNTSQPGSIFILRLDLTLIQVVLSIIRMLHDHDAQVRLYFPNCHRNTNFVYLIAIANHILTAKIAYTHINPPGIPYRSIISPLRNWIRRQPSRYITVDGLLGVKLTSTIRYSLYWSLKYEPLWISYVQQHLHITPPLAQALFDHTKHSDYWKIYPLNILRYITSIERILIENGPQATFRDSTHDMNTVAHRVAIITWWLRLRGYHYISELYRTHPDGVFITENAIKSKFLEYVMKLPPRDLRRYPIDRNDIHKIFRKDYVDHAEQPVSLYRDFILGVRIAFSQIAASHMCLRVQQDDGGDRDDHIH